MTGQNWKPVANALLGSWPSQVNSWGPEVLAAFCSELAARGVTPDAALIAVRSYSPDADFPPSAARLAQVARSDAKAPAGMEIAAVLWGPKGVMHARAPYPEGGWRGPDGHRRADDQARLDAATVHGPLVAAFVESVGVDALKAHDPVDAEWGPANGRWLAAEWEAFQIRASERGVHALLAQRRVEGLAELRRRQGGAQAKDRLALEEGSR